MDLGVKVEYKRYFIYSNNGIEMRVQQKGNKFELERKEKVDSLVSKKDKIIITKEEFDILRTLSNASIERDSYIVAVDGYEVSIKVYTGAYKGFIRAEVEFGSREEAEKYIVPDWFGMEITGTKIGRDSGIVKLGRVEFEGEIGKMDTNIEIKIIDYNSDEYKKELELRDLILRKPIGLSVYNDNLTDEINDYHIGAWVDSKLAGVLVLTKLTDTDIKMRQVAVVYELQGCGIGARLVCYAEDFANELGYKKMVLNSRETAVKFYLKLGYERVGERFIEVGMPHYKMVKWIG